MISGNNLRYYPTLKKKNLIASDKFCFKTKLNISTHDDLRKKKKKKTSFVGARGGFDKVCHSRASGST